MKQCSHRLRIGRFSEPGRLYLVTTATRGRAPRFAELTYARAVIQELKLSHRAGLCHSLAWVLMPDHLHWLIELSDKPLSDLMRQFKSKSSHALYRLGVPRAQIWQSGYHDRAVRRDEDVRRIARYIVGNPLRAGLVNHIGEYPHWDCVWI